MLYSSDLEESCGDEKRKMKWKDKRIGRSYEEEKVRHRVPTKEKKNPFIALYYNFYLNLSPKQEKLNLYFVQYTEQRFIFSEIVAHSYWMTLVLLRPEMWAMICLCPGY